MRRLTARTPAALAAAVYVLVTFLLVFFATVHFLLAVIVVWLAGSAVLLLAIHRAYRKPIERLNASVEQWRLGKAYVPPGRDENASVRRLGLTMHRATRSLAQQQAKVVQSTRQQHLAMQEIHHRVKNNLQVVASLLNLQASRIRQPEARAEFQSARDRIRALATLHRHLYVYGEIHTIDMGEFLNELCEQLFKSLGEEPGGRLKLTIDAPALKVSSDQAVPLALIVTEAVTNAVKYAFPDDRPGRISVTLHESGGTATLEIADDGVGIPRGRQQTEAGVRDGIGLQLINGFARQLNATLLVEEVFGTRYVVTVPLREERFDSPSVTGA